MHCCLPPHWPWPIPINAPVRLHRTSTAQLLPPEDYVWFNAVLKVNGLGSTPARIFVTHASITFTANGQTYQLTVPDAQITLSNSVTLATTFFAKLSPEIGSPLGWRAGDFEPPVVPEPAE